MHHTHSHPFSLPAIVHTGYTVDPLRRLRQHNGLISGGARGTRGGRGSWSFLFVVTASPPSPPSLSAAVVTGSISSMTEGFEPIFGAHEGLSLEWHLKRRRRSSPGKRRAQRSLKGPNTASMAGRSLPQRDGSTQFSGAIEVLATLPRPVAHRLEVLRDVLQLHKFSAFCTRFIVYASPDTQAAVTALLSGLPCSVRPLAELIPP